MSIQLRPATEGDWPAAWAIQRAAFADLVERSSGGWTAELAGSCAANWRPDEVLLVEQAGELIGWIQRERRAEHDWLELINIAPAHQGRGIGSALVRMLMADADARGVPLWLSVYQINRARGLYRALGFCEHPRDGTRVLMVYPADSAMPPPSRG